jgi:DNA-binding transcriptional MerR regulator
MRVYELARALGQSPRFVVDRLRAEGEWVQSHLSTVTKPVADRYLADGQVAVDRQDVHVTTPDGTAGDPGPSIPAAEPHSPRNRWSRRRPGPRAFTMQGPPVDEDDDPVENLRYRTEITTRDVADLLDVTQSTVRRWVARGYINPTGKSGPSHLFNTRDVLAAHDEIQARRKATGKQRRQHRYGVELRRIDRIRPKHYDAVVSVREAARLIDVSPPTIRSWIHRRHLMPLASSTPRAVRLRLGDVVTAARSRRLPGRSY